MHTVLVISGGLALLAVFCIVGRAKGGQSGRTRAAKAFIPFWAVLSVVNMVIGVVSAGYTVLQELPVLIVVFGIPAVAAAFFARSTKTE